MRLRGLISPLALLLALALPPTGSSAPNPKLDARLGALAERGGSGKVRVVVEARAASGRVRAALAEAGGSVKGEYANLVDALVPASALGRIAASGDVRYVRPPFRFEPMAVQGEGVAVTNASGWQAAGWGGAGAKVAVIDLGFDDYELRQATGDLPRSVTTQNFCSRGLSGGGESHGTAVAEIVHEMAPRAQLFLVCVESEVGLGLAKDYAKAQGIPIVNFSAGTYNTSRGDGTGGPGTPDAIVRDARASGILWVNSAGNEAQTHWSGAFSDAEGNRFHNFRDADPTRPADETNEVDVGGKATVCALLKWDDWNQTATGTDYDVYVDTQGSEAPQAPSPTAEACYTNPSGSLRQVSIRIEKVSGPPTDRLDLFVLDGYNLEHSVAAGSLPEPASSPNVMAVGASCWQNGTLQRYSSQGPTIDGRAKPDIAAPDSVSSGTYGGFNGQCGGAGFTGTSASAPHVTGAAALLKQANPALGVDDLQRALESDAGGTKDYQYGAGNLVLRPAPIDGTPPSAPALIAPGAVYQLQRLFGVTSTAASDGETGVASYAIRYRRAAAGGGLGAHAVWSTGTTPSSATFTGSPGYTYCFSAQARDFAGNVSPSGAERCTSVPLNNTALAHKGAWAKRTGSGHYLGTYSLSSRRGAALVRARVVAKRLALVAARCARCGTVNVFWNGRLVKRIALRAATTRKRQVVTIASFASPRRGTVKAVIASSGKPVRIEGLAVSKT